MSLLTDLVIRLHDLNNVELERLARELERIRVLASRGVPGEPTNVYQDGNPRYVSLGGETNDIALWSGADLIIYSDAGTTEKARIDGATGNITTAGTVDGIDVAGAAAAEYVCISGDANIANERILTGTTNQIVVTDNGAGSTVVLSTPQDIHTAATPTFGGIIIADGGTIGQAAGPLLTFDDTNDYLEITGCRVGIGVVDPHSELEVAGAISSATLLLSAAGPTDDLDVSGVNTIFVDTSSNNVTLGGTSGGVDGQVLNIIVHDKTNNFTIENEEGGATQPFFLHAGSDEVMTAEYGGWVFVNDGGAHWHDASHAKHV